MSFHIHGICSDKQENQGTKAKPVSKKKPQQAKSEFLRDAIEKIGGDDFPSDEERQAYENKIQQKIKSGAKLSQKEMNYLRKYNPYMYQQMERVQKCREILKEQLRHCRTKEEAQRMISNAFSAIGDDDPAREAMIAAVRNVSEQYRSSEVYQKLPDTEENLKSAKSAEDPSEDPFKEEDSKDEDNTISYGTGLGGYQEAVAGGVSDAGAFQMGA